MFHHSRRMPLKIAPLLLAWLGVSACATQKVMLEVPGVRYVSGDYLSKYLRIEQLRLGYTETGTSRAWARIENVSGAPREFLARVVFVGEGHRKIEPEPGWSRVFLDKHGVTTFEGVSMNMQAREALLEIKDP